MTTPQKNIAAPRSEKKRQFLAIAGISAAVLVILVLVIYLLTGIINRALYAERKTSLAKLTEASAKTVDEAIAEEWKLVLFFSGIAEKEMEEAESVASFIADMNEKAALGSDMYFFVDESGKYYSSDGANGAIVDRTYFTAKTEDQLEYIGTLPHLSTAQTDLIFRLRFDRPIALEYDGHTVQMTYCCVMHDLTALNETVSDLFQGANNTFIYDSTGVMLYKQFDLGMLISGYNIYSKFRQGTLMNGEDPDTLIAQCKNRETMVAEMEIDDTLFYVCSTPLSVSDWSLFFVVQKSYISAASATGFRAIIIVVAAVTILLACVVLACVVSLYRRRLRKESEKTATYDKLLDTYLHTYDSVYRVNTAADTIRKLTTGTDAVSSNANSSGANSNDGNGEIRYTDFIAKYITSEVYIGDRSKMRRVFSLAGIKETMKSDNHFSVQYRAMIENDPYWFEIMLSAVDKDTVLIGLTNRDEEILWDTVSRTVMQDYFALYLLDLTEGKFMQIGSDGKKINSRKGRLWLPAADRYLQNCSPETQPLLRPFSDVSDICKIMGRDERREILHQYRKNPDADYIWRRATFQVVERRKDIPAAVVLTLEELDAESAEKETLNQTIAAQKQQLEKQQDILEQALITANQASSAKSTFLFNMSHDIRTPMNAIIGFTNIAIKNIHQQDKVADCLQKTKQSGTLLLSLINEILEMSRIESGKHTLTETACELPSLLTNTMAILEDMATEKNLDITVDFSGIRNGAVYCDPMGMQRILMNLVTNAIKYTNVGGWVRISASEEPADAPGTAFYHLTVADNGIGMSAEFQQHMFDEFAREENTTLSGVQGTGLGLPLCKALTEKMGGSITVESRLGIGSTFTVIVPLRQQESADKTAVSDNTEEFSLAGLHILLVEDNLLNREIASDMLSDLGLITEEAEDGLNALEKIAAYGIHAFDAVLMDIQMPRMNGTEAAAEIRKRYPESHIPIIALSANAFTEDREQSAAAGMNDHLAKPIEEAQLVSVLKKHLQSRARDGKAVL